MTYGYARVSTDGQGVDARVRQLTQARCKKVFRETVSGTHADRPQFKNLMQKLAARDVLVIRAVHRLSRDTTDLLVLAMLDVAAKLERRRIMKRTACGRADAKARGVAFGRKPILTPRQQKEAQRRAEGATPKELAKSYNVGAATISRLGA